MSAGGTHAPYYLHVLNEATTGKWFTQNVHGVAIEPGQWYKIELHLKRSSSDGAPDGLVEWWVNGQLAARYPNAQLHDEPWSELHMAPVWGGGGGYRKAHEDYFRFGRLRVSGQ
jgi:hypothetical protein